MAAGNQSVVLPQMGSGIYLYKVKLGKAEFLLKSNSVGEVSRGTAEFSQRVIGDKALGKKALIVSAISDVIGVTKEGYLNYEIAMTIPVDTSGIKIKMIVCADTVRDADGNLYHAVRIGNQVWTVENLRTTKYNDGSAIPLDTSTTTWANDTTPKYCYFNNTTNADSINKFGSLYNWYVVSSANPKKLAPTGWHVPSDSEWTVLEKYLVLNGYNWDGTTDTSKNNKIAKSMAVKTDWVTWPTTGTPGCDLTKNNTSCFSAIPTGSRGFDGVFSIQSNYFSMWWSATTHYASQAYSRELSYDGDNLYRYSAGDYESCGFSVRLVRDK
jgi:uncharacterized protein (TIGR02145 family)